jgi:hypothetical protein
MARTTVKKSPKSKAETKAGAKPVNNTKTYAVVDHPSENAELRVGSYTYRVGAGDCEKVEISLDGNTWLPCRHAVGFWWFDTHHGTKGTHQVIARAVCKNGAVLISKRRRFKVS